PASGGSQTRTCTIADVATQVDLGTLDQVEGQIPVIARYSSEDFGASASAKEVESELLRVAAIAFLGIKKQQLLPGRALPASPMLDDKVRSAEQDVQQIFIPPASAKLQQTSPTSSDWIFNITGIKRVDVVGLYVEPIQKQLDSAKQNDLATAQALDKKRLSIQQRMQEKYLPKLSSQPGQFIKLEQLTK